MADKNLKLKSKSVTRRRLRRFSPWRESISGPSANPDLSGKGKRKGYLRRFLPWSESIYEQSASSDKSELAGQALAEILISVTITGLVLGSAAFVIVSVINSNKSISKVKAATGLARELMDSVRVYADYDWDTFYGVNKGSGNHYYLDVSTTPFVNVSGDGSVSQDNITYTRYFYVENVNRSYDDVDNIASAGGAEDPSTQKITVGVSWQGGDALTFTEYISQWRNYTAAQSDWSGGTGQESAVTRLGNDYFASTAINASTTGEFELLGY